MKLDTNLWGTKFWDVQFQVQRSYRYSLARQKHFEFLSRLTSFLIIVLTASSGYVFTKSTDWYVLILPLVVVLISILDLLWRPSKTAAIHEMLAKRFILLDMKMTTAKDSSDSMATEFQEMKLEIDLDEPPDVEVANILSHNELCAANEIDDQGYQMGWFRRLFAQWGFVLPPKEWVKVADHKKALEQKSPNNALQMSA